MENRVNYEKLKAEIQNLTHRMDQMEKEHPCMKNNSVKPRKLCNQ